MVKFWRYALGGWCREHRSDVGTGTGQAGCGGAKRRYRHCAKPTLSPGIKVSAGTDSPSDIVPACRFWLPWFRDPTSGAAVDKTYQGDAAKQGLGSATQTRGYFTSKDGTFGTSGTGLYYEIDAVRGNFELDAQRDFPLHDQHGGARLDQIPGIDAVQQQLAGNPDRGDRCRRTQAVLARWQRRHAEHDEQHPGMCDGTDHDITLVFDRNERKCYVFADGVLFETKVLAGTGTTDSGAGMRFGGYAGNGTCDAKFANAHMYVFAADAADFDVNALVDKLVLQRQPLLRSDV